MRIPGQIKCDLCGSTIEHESRSVRISLPLTEDLRKQIIASVERSPMPAGILNIFPIEARVPREWTLEACGCVVRLLPMLAEVVAADVQRSIEAHSRARGVTLGPVTSLEEL